MSAATHLALTLSDATGVPYYRQIETQLAELIRVGRLPAGERLPSVRELALQLKVSVITTRRTYAASAPCTTRSRSAARSAS